MAIPTVLGVATGRPAPSPARAEAEGTWALRSGAGHQWGGGQNRWQMRAAASCRTPDRRWHRGRCLPRLRIPRIGVDAHKRVRPEPERGAPPDSDLGASPFSADISGSTFDRKLFPVMRRGEEDDMSAFTVEFDNRAGELARLCEAMAAHGVNIVVCGAARRYGHGCVHR